LIRILIADDSIVFRRMMTDVIGALEGCVVVGHAHNGRVALDKVRELSPDIMTLDMEMPEVDGLQVLDNLRNVKNKPVVIVVSAQTERGGELTLKALQCGAFDFITKPHTGSMETAKEALRDALAPRIKALSLRYSVRDILHKAGHDQGAGGGYMPGVSNDSAKGSIRIPGRADGGSSDFPSTPGQKEFTASGVAPTRVEKGASLAGNQADSPANWRKTGTIPMPLRKPDIVLIGVSTGGPNALAQIIPALPATLGVPVFIVQHMPPLFTKSLADSLDKKSKLTVTEAEHNMQAAVNTVYIAPGGKHMRILSSVLGEITIQITEDAPENNCRPSVDYLFRSVSQHFPGRALSVVLTGMGSDGTLGVRLLKRSGCITLVQDEQSCVVYGMPKSVADAGLADAILPLNRIPEMITHLVKQ
jgi:two-component system, chemotaxis family, protein-glutamate methylesterase/glutaminase